MKYVLIILLVFVGMSIFRYIRAQIGVKGVTRLDANEFEAEVSKKKVQLIDVRSQQEFGTGHIPGATNINVYSPQFASKVQHLKKDQPVYVYCRSGNRSMAAARILAKSGFTNIIDLKGGISAWQGKIK